MPADESTLTAPLTPPALPPGDEPQPMAGLSVGRIVNYVLDKPYSAGEAPTIRPAIIVHVLANVTGWVNLQVFTDGTNDGVSASTGTIWKNSRRYSEGREVGTWHWPPRQS